MEADAVLEVLSALDDASVPEWLGGGRGVDALLGEQTRYHADLDIILSSTDVATLQEALRAIGFRIKPEGSAVNFILADQGGRAVDGDPRWEAPIPAFGACHGIDIAFVFGAAREDTISMFTGAGPEAKALAENVMDAWLAFARPGDPNHSGLAEWPCCDTERRPTMQFGKTCEIVEDPQGAERLAWQGIL